MVVKEFSDDKGGAAPTTGRRDVDSQYIDGAPAALKPAEEVIKTYLHAVGVVAIVARLDAETQEPLSYLGTLLYLAAARLKERKLSDGIHYLQLSAESAAGIVEKSERIKRGSAHLRGIIQDVARLDQEKEQFNPANVREQVLEAIVAVYGSQVYVLEAGMKGDARNE